MNKNSRSATFKQFGRFLFTGLLALMVSLGCHASEGETVPFEPLFHGLAKGKYSKDTACVTVEGLSTILDLDGFEQKLQVFSSADCKKEALRFTKMLSIESQIAGIWNHHIVIDEGTDVNGRELHLINVKDSSKKYSFYYALQPVFKGSYLTYLLPLEIDAKPEQCSSDQKTEIAEWKRFGFGMELAEQRIFNIQNNKTINTKIKKCFPLQ